MSDLFSDNLPKFVRKIPNMLLSSSSRCCSSTATTEKQAARVLRFSERYRGLPSTWLIPWTDIPPHIDHRPLYYYLQRRSPGQFWHGVYSGMIDTHLRCVDKNVHGVHKTYTSSLRYVYMGLTKFHPEFALRLHRVVKTLHQVYFILHQVYIIFSVF